MAQRKIKVIKKERKINIFMPCKFTENYVRYEYFYIDTKSDNMHQWRVLGIAIANPDLTDKFILNTSNEWEGAIQEVNAKDFIGGYHGDETNTAISFMADGKMLDADSNFEIECDYFKATAESVLNRCDTPGDDVFKRRKVSEWGKEGYIVTNHFELLQDFEINRFENIMMGFDLVKGDKRFITHAASNNNPVPVFVDLNPEETLKTPLFIPDRNASSFEFFAPEYNFYAKVEGFFDNQRFPNGFRRFDEWRLVHDKYIKAYFNMTGRHSGKKGETFDSKSIFTIEA
jgi:hypothetical protein